MTQQLERVPQVHQELPVEHLVRLTIDGQEAVALPDQTILAVAKGLGIQIPTLCNDNSLEPFGGCRLCIVEIEGYDKPLPSCTMKVAEGMIVRTDTERLKALRKLTLELTLSDHNAYCMPPCQINCPTHINIPLFLEANAKGDYRESARIVKEVLPFPSTLGRVCPRPCQTVCRRQLVEEEIQICFSHRYCGDKVWDDPPTPWPPEPSTGKRVAVVGAGPAGLSCAYYLALKGHKVVVYEALPKPGGMLRYGIPAYRLPKEEVLDQELECVWKLGVEPKYNMALGRDFTTDDLLQQGYDAVFLGIGAHRSNRMDVPGEDLPGVVTAVEFLRNVGLGEKVDPGKRVVVIGGGFTAVDAARTSLRLGATDVTIAYRRSQAEMPAHRDEVADAEHEGVKLELLAAPVRVIEENGRAKGIELQRMTLGEPDARGRRRPVPVPGSEFVIEADTIIAAIGQMPDVSFLAKETGIKSNERECIVVNPYNYQTAKEKVFAGGDATIGAATVIQAVAAGKLAAKSIDSYLKGENMEEVARRIEAEERKPDLISIVPSKPITKKTPMRILPLEDRKLNFRQVELGYSDEEAKREAERCLQCTCPAAGRCELQQRSLEHGCTTNRFHNGEQSDYHHYETDYSHGLILREPNKCIWCNRCVRVCRDVVGPDCYSFAGHGLDAIVTTAFDLPLGKTNCISCGSCAKTCPTGALVLRDRVLESYTLDVSRCIFCSECVEVCPHNALAVSPNFELATYRRFDWTKINAEEMAQAQDFGYKRTRGAESPDGLGATHLKGAALDRAKHHRQFKSWGE